MKRIVVGVDGSDGSARALRWAVEEARRWDATVEAIHTWSPPYAGVGVESGWAIADPVLAEAATTLLDEAVDAVDTSGLGQPVVRTVRCGHPAATLLEAGEDADLLVVGSRGLGGFGRLLLGSTSTQVVHHAPCPVVVVPPGS